MKKCILSLALVVAAFSGAQAQRAPSPVSAKDFTFTTVKENPITPVKNQNNSGTCWCFSGLSFLESEVIKAKPNARLLANRADCYLTQKQLNQAEEDIRAALSMTPDDPYLYVLRAKLAKLRFSHADMEQDIQLAVEKGLERKLVDALLN